MGEVGRARLCATTSATVETVQKTVEVLQFVLIDKGVDVSVTTQRQVPAFPGDSGRGTDTLIDKMYKV